ncbi:MAG TPA: c-type cytochrome [Allosphingosinicella sp.]|nr:c-type cytochrome [Allosphingosinicella sp.]
MVDEPPSSLWHEISRTVRRLKLRHEGRILRIVMAGGLVFVGGILALAAIVWMTPASPPRLTAAEPAVSEGFQPRPESEMPEGPQGDAIRRGRDIFTNTRVHAAQYVGSDLSCSSCHLDAGRQANSSPMWAAWVAYPRYRSKDRAISTMEDRIRGCFTYSMNAQYSPAGAAPPPGSDLYRDLQSYFYWLAEGAPTGRALAGAGYPTPPLPASGYDYGRGEAVYEQYCVACHGADGAGQRNPDNSVVIPPLWGDRSFNWGAGMARIDLAAGFVQANMPLGQGNTLSDQEAWDVAAFIDSHERPKDPRQTGSVAQNAEQNFAGQHSYYGRVVNGRTIGAGTSRQ